MSGDEVTLPICVVPYSRDWHQASHSLTFWFVWWLSGTELVTSHKTTRIVTDLINRIVQVLRGDLYWFRISAQDAGLMEPVEP